MYQFNAKDSEIKPCPICLDHASKDFTINNIKKNRIKRKCNSFFVDYNPINTSDILDIHKFLMK